MSTLQKDARAAAVTLFTEFAASLTPPLTLQVYPGRPRSIAPPTAFVDAIHEHVDYDGLRQRHPTVECIVVHGLFDTADTADQKDAFVDAFVDWVTADVHAAGANTVIALTGTEDIPAWQADWMPPDQRRSYYATQITLEVLGN